MLYGLRKKFNKMFFDLSLILYGIDKTKPIQVSNEGDLTVVSQVYPGDVLMYLLAIKSFTRFVKPSHIIIVGDKLRTKDIDLLKKHIPEIEIIDLKSITTSQFPSGGCWERLYTIVNKTKNQYVIQLDSDTITFKMPEEVINSIDNGRAFTLGTTMGTDIITCKKISEKAEKINSTHVQVLSEKAMSHIEGDYKYIRGCAAFTGFPASDEYHDKLLMFSNKMKLVLGQDKWNEWGSEQVSSNFLIANTTAPLILPLNKYDFFKPDKDLTKHTLIHYIGSFRFEKGHYLKMAKQIVDQLS